MDSEIEKDPDINQSPFLISFLIQGNFNNLDFVQD